MILGEDYVNMTIENIKKGNPIGVYESGSNWGSTLYIIQNNIIKKDKNKKRRNRRKKDRNQRRQD